MANTNKRITYQIEINDKGKVKVEGLTTGFIKLDNAVKKVNQDLLQQGDIMEDNAKKNQKMIDKTGLAGAAMIEIGRTISDSNYGMRAMANNISQLATLMITLMMTSGGLVGGIKQLLKVAIGPVGLIVAFQILIARMEKAAMVADSFKREANAIGDALGKAGSDLVTFLRILDRGNISQKEMASTVEQLSDNYKDLNIQLDDEGNLTEESRLAIEEKIKSLKKLAKAQAIQLEIEKLYQEQIQAQLIKDEDLLEAANREGVLKKTQDFFNFAVDSSEKIVIKGRETVLPKLGQFFREIKRVVSGTWTQEDVDAYKAFLSREEIRRKDDIQSNFDAETKKRENKIEALIQSLTETDSINEAFGNREQEKELERIDRLEALRKKYVDKAKIDDTLHKDEQLEAEKQMVLEKARIDKAGKELLEAIETEFNQKIDAARQTRELKEYKEFERRRLQRIRFNQEAIKLEQDRIRAEQNIAIQKVGFAKQIAGMLSTIAKEGSALAKAALVLEKGAAIADIVIKAQQSIATQTAASGAYSLQVQAAYGAIPFIGPAIAGALIATNKTTLAKNIAMTKIGAGLSIANILATSLTSKQKALPAVSAASTPSTSTPQIQAPAFNVVGATQTSQLAQTIAGSEEQPLRAYVVASDISTAQELERSTIEGASMG